VCSCIACKRETSSKEKICSSENENDDLYFEKEGSRKKPGSKRKERRLNIEGCKYRIIFRRKEKEKDCYRYLLYRKSVFHHNHPPVGGCRKVIYFS
jgi:hypothetical protein